MDVGLASLLISSCVAIIALALKLAYSSKCSSIDCCWGFFRCVRHPKLETTQPNNDDKVMVERQNSSINIVV